MFGYRIESTGWKSARFILTLGQDVQDFVIPVRGGNKFHPPDGHDMRLGYFDCPSLKLSETTKIPKATSFSCFEVIMCCLSGKFNILRSKCILHSLVADLLHSCIYGWLYQVYRSRL